VSQHFLLSAHARTLSLGVVFRMTDMEAETAFKGVRWAATAGKPVCPHCECPTVWDCRNANGSPRWRCKACRKSFSITSGTLFAFHKMPLRNYLAAIAIFCNEVKGKSALALSRDLGCQFKTAFVLAHKLREAMASEMKGRHLGGDGETVEVDGGYFGGYVKPSNHLANRRDRRLAKNQNGKRQVVVVMRERGGSTLPAVFKSESSAQVEALIAAAAPHLRPLIEFLFATGARKGEALRPGGAAADAGAARRGTRPARRRRRPHRAALGGRRKTRHRAGERGAHLSSAGRAG
jgi:transposase-like protein